MNRLALTTLFAFYSLAANVPPIAAPDTVKPGDKFKYSVVIPETPCSKTYFDGTSTSLNIQISGSGVTLTADAPLVTACSLVVTMSADANVAFGDHLITVYSSPDAITKKQDLIGTFHLYVTSSTPGPIPPGISPQVDVMWNILSENSCSDQFGLRIARRYYCAEVVLGNNSGFPLIISGVGFRHTMPGFDYKEANISYLNVRAAAQREQTISGRNITLRALQAAGVTVAGFAPFARNTIPHLHITIWATILGTVLAGAWDGLVPDRTIVQSHNLDDAAIRDGKLFPNNSPVRFTIFAERDSVKPLLMPLPDRMHYMIRIYGEIAEDIRRGIAPSDPDADKAAKEQQAKGWEDMAVKMQARAKTAPSPDKPVADAGKKRNPIGRHTTDDERDLMQVRALGALVLVGDQIEYKQRIQVDSNAVNPEIAARPFINGAPIITPVLADGDTDSRTVTINGGNLTGAKVSISSQLTTEPPVPFTTPTLTESDAVHVKFNFALTTAQAKSGATITFTLTTNGGSVTTSAKVPPPT